MKFYFDGCQYQAPQNGKLGSVYTTPATNSRACRKIFVLLANEIGKPESGQKISLGLVGEKKTPMAFPPKKDDSRILVMGNIPQPGHRSDGFLWREKSTGKILDESCGGGAWGSGSCFLALLEEGQQVTSVDREVWQNINGELVKHKFSSIAEYDLAFGSPTIEEI